MNNHILNLKGISVEKNDVCILEDINLEIKQGDFLNIYGMCNWIFKMSQNIE